MLHLAIKYQMVSCEAIKRSNIIWTERLHTYSYMYMNINYFIYIATIKEIVALKFRENMGCVQKNLEARKKEEKPFFLVFNTFYKPHEFYMYMGIYVWEIIEANKHWVQILKIKCGHIWWKYD